MPDDLDLPVHSRLSPDQRTNLVAYLDGELDVSESREIDLILARSPTARRDLEALTRTWEMLDHLPHPKLDEDFPTRTLERIETEELRIRLQRWRRLQRVRRFALGFGWLASVGGALAVGFLAVWLWPNPSRQLLDQLPLIENLESYRAVGERDFLRELHQSATFTNHDPS